jgi:hypothetical protein
VAQGPIADPAGDEVGVPTGPVSVDIELRREGTRERIALILLAILAGEVLFALLSQMGPRPAPMKDMMAIIFGPTVALVGSALGFYYGTRTNSKP